MKKLLILLTILNVVVLVFNVLTVKTEDAKDYSPYIEMIKRHDVDLNNIDKRLDERQPIIDKLINEYYEIDSIYTDIDSSELNHRLDDFFTRHNRRPLVIK